MAAHMCTGGGAKAQCTADTSSLLPRPYNKQVTQTREWREEIAPRYDAVMVADDDLQMTTCAINR